VVPKSRYPLSSRVSFFRDARHRQNKSRFAVAGVFGLAIYSISFADPDIIESELVRLFSTLPKTRIVLLEDIDAAGLKKRTFGGWESGQNHVTTYKLSGRIDPISHRGISLSGLLNAIDGVASHEGRALIMTANVPEALDPTLIRPGRIDMHVHFELATRSQIRELFLAMYHDPNGNPTTTSSSVALTDEKNPLRALADAFAATLPPDYLSLAAVRGHLLHYKHDPRKAVLGAQSWGKTMLGEEASPRASTHQA
jgi:chaperone BCS1